MGEICAAPRAILGEHELTFPELARAAGDDVLAERHDEIAARLGL
jgi:hypothetical protein